MSLRRCEPVVVPIASLVMGAHALRLGLKIPLHVRKKLRTARGVAKTPERLLLGPGEAERAVMTIVQLAIL